MHILFIGYGKTSQRVAKKLFAEGHTITAVSVSKKNDAVASHLQQDVHHLNLSAIKPVDYVYIALSPKYTQDYQNIYLDSVHPILSALKQHPIKRLIILSSTRVYNGYVEQEITDNTVPLPNDEQGNVLYKMEQEYQKAYSKNCIIVRPTGIYGTSIARMQKMANATTHYTSEHWSNRIHIDDLSDFLAMLVTVKHVYNSYIVTDNKPYPLHEIIWWFQKKLNLPLLNYVPQQKTGKKIKASRMYKHFKLTHHDCFKVYDSFF